MKEFILYSRDTLRYMILHTLYLPTQPIMYFKLPSLKMPRYLLPPPAYASLVSAPLLAAS
jgi:hypothetical protein